MEQTRTFLSKHIILILLAIVVALVGATYALGYRIEPGGIARVGTLTLTGLPVGTTIYTEETYRMTVKKAGDVSLELGPGNHSVVVNAPNDYPWSTIARITSNQEMHVTPLLVHMNLKVAQLDGADKTLAIRAIATSTLPTPQAPLSTMNGCVNVYVSNNQVIATAATSTPGCTPPPYLCAGGTCAETIIYAPVAHLTNVFLYPGRQDALAVAFGGTLYALAIDPSTPQFFAPLVRGATAHYGQLSDGSIVVQDGTTVAKIGF